jgi:MoaA/NifB/PqqE/SkfB family radical SAM enzyme
MRLPTHALLPLAHLRPFPLDGALLLFDRDTGLNALCDGPETAHLCQLAPRAVQFGITHRCNLACTFCSRDLAAESAWTAAEAFAVLASAGARFGVNYLVTPARLPALETTVVELASFGCRDVLLLSYNGHDRSLHLDAAEARDLARRVGVLSRALERRCQLKLDVCWGERMDGVPRLLDRNDCGAGRDFLVLTSDRKLQPCSFHDLAIPVRDASDVMTVWRTRRADLAAPSSLPGCARVPGYGLQKGAS